MTEITTEQEKQEHHTESEKVGEHKAVEHSKEGFNFAKWLKGSNTKEFAENASFLMIFVSAVMVSGGISLGALFTEAIFVAIVGAFFVMVGIIIYIASQFIGE